jgi:hypothetical protein
VENIMNFPENKECQLVLKIPSYAMAGTSHELKNADQIELSVTMRLMDCYDVEQDHIEYNYETIYVKGNWDYNKDRFNIGTPKTWKFENWHSYFSITCLADAYFNDRTTLFSIEKTTNSETYLNMSSPWKVEIEFNNKDIWTKRAK